MYLVRVIVPTILIGMSQISLATPDGNFKRFSVSAGWLHVMLQGKANPFYINTGVKEGTVSTVGSISTDSFLNSVDPDATFEDLGGVVYNTKDSLDELIHDAFLSTLLTDGNGNVLPEVSGSATINGLSSWQSARTGLEADDVDTLGLTFNYYVNDNVSLQLIGGIPPNVDIKGKGEIFAPLTGLAISPNELVNIFLK